MRVYQTKKNYSYKFEDLIATNSNNDLFNHVIKPHDLFYVKLGWSSTSNSTEFESVLNGVNFIRLWYNNLVPKYINSVIAYSEEDYDFTSVVDKTIINKVFKGFINGFISILMGTYERYTTLIGLYTSNKDKLMKQLESSTSTKSSFNETPQTEVNDPYDTKYSNNTSVSEYTNLTDTGTIMSRIKEIDDNLKNLYKDWAYEFDSLFVPTMEGYYEREF